jgi:hypothetical protein
MAVFKNCVAEYAGKDGFHLRGSHTVENCATEKTRRDGINAVGNVQVDGFKVGEAGRYAYCAYDDDRCDALSKLVEAFENNFGQLSDELRSDKLKTIGRVLEELKKELQSSPPNQGVIRSGLQSLRTILEGAAGNMLAQYLSSLIIATLPLWGD